MCGFCDITNVSEEPLNLFSEEEIDNVIIGIYAGFISVYSLDVNTYLKIARKLSEGVFEGYGKNMSQVIFNTEDFEMLKSLRDNVYHFSAAKQYQFTREAEEKLIEINKALVKDNKIVQFSEFKKEAKAIFTKYNENYLRAEYNSAIAQSRTASQWQEIQKQVEFLPMLTYVTAGDGRVRPQHEILNNITRPVDDKFWDKFMPPNGWNCRCTVLQSSDEVKTPIPSKVSVEDVPPIFRFNAGKEKMVFSPKHPYFKEVPRKDKEFAKQNFGLPI